MKSSFCLSIMSGAAKFMATVAPRTALLGADSFDARIWAVAMPEMARPNLQSGEGIFDCYFFLHGSFRVRSGEIGNVTL